MIAFDFYSHRLMLHDQVRVEAFDQALRQCVRPGDVVLDLGTGTGLLAFCALRAGAGHVLALDMASTLEVSQELATWLGFSDHITFLPLNSMDLELDDRVDVVVSETLGCLALDENCAQYLWDAKQRLLKPGGTMIPQQASLHFQLLDEGIDPALSVPTLFPDLNLSALNFDQKHQAKVMAYPLSACLGPAEKMFEVDFTQGHRTLFHGSCPLSAARDGRCAGVGGWFRTQLSPGICLETGPEAPETSWKRMVFPIPEPFAIKRAESLMFFVECKSQAHQTLWAWKLADAQGNVKAQGDYQQGGVVQELKPDLLSGVLPRPRRLARQRFELLKAFDQTQSFQEAVSQFEEGGDANPLRSLAENLAMRFGRHSVKTKTAS